MEATTKIRKIAAKINLLINEFLLDAGVFIPPLDDEVSKNGWHYNLA